MAERETAIQNAAKKQLVDMEARCEELGKKVESAVQELSQVKHQANEHEAKLKKQICKVRSRYPDHTFLQSYLQSPPVRNLTPQIARHEP